MFKFDWGVLTREDEQAAQDFLNNSFKAVPLPDYVGPISVSGLSFGTEPPLVQLLNISGLTDKTRERLAEEPEFEDGFGEADLEVAVKLAYRGNASFRVHTELVVNFPSPNFGRLPITLAVTELAFDGVARLVKVRDQLFLTFDDEDDEAAGAAAAAAAGAPPHGSLASPFRAAAAAEDAAAAAADAESDGLAGGAVGPLKGVRIESEIGDEAQAVLRDTGLIEKFIVEQLQAIVRKRLVFPNLLAAPV